MSIKQTVQRHDQQLNDALRNQVGVSVDQYKLIRFLFRAIGILLVGYAIILPDVDPTGTMFLVLAALVLGPDVVEEYLTRDQ